MKSPRRDQKYFPKRLVDAEAFDVLDRRSPFIRENQAVRLAIDDQHSIRWIVFLRFCGEPTDDLQCQIADVLST